MAFRITSTRKIHCFHHSTKFLLTLLSLAVVFDVVFSTSRIVVLHFEDISKNLAPDFHNLQLLKSSKTIKQCDVFEHSRTVGELQWPKEHVDEEDLETIRKRYSISPGGFWKPTKCMSLYSIAIIIPYRDRLVHLRSFLEYMHPFLIKQNLEYRIVVVEQVPGRLFNRAKLFNVGFRETEKLWNVSCYIFHDVDLIPQNPRNVYACTYLVRHMSSRIDANNYTTPYELTLGGVAAIRKCQFVDVNGFSNTFFGWGGEDDDFFKRNTKDNEEICRFAPDISQYTAMKHEKQTPNPDRYRLLKTSSQRFSTDGLNSLEYTALKVELLPLYTRILADL